MPFPLFRAGLLTGVSFWRFPATAEARLSDVC